MVWLISSPVQPCTICSHLVSYATGHICQWPPQLHPRGGIDPGQHHGCLGVGDHRKYHPKPFVRNVRPKDGDMSTVIESFVVNRYPIRTDPTEFWVLPGGALRGASWCRAPWWWQLTAVDLQSLGPQTLSTLCAQRSWFFGKRFWRCADFLGTDTRKSGSSHQKITRVMVVVVMVITRAGGNGSHSGVVACSDACGLLFILFDGSYVKCWPVLFPTLSHKTILYFCKNGRSNSMNVSQWQNMSWMYVRFMHRRAYCVYICKYVYIHITCVYTYTYIRTQIYR